MRSNTLTNKLLLIIMLNNRLQPKLKLLKLRQLMLNKLLHLLPQRHRRHQLHHRLKQPQQVVPILNQQLLLLPISHQHRRLLLHCKLILHL